MTPRTITDREMDRRIAALKDGEQPGRAAGNGEAQAPGQALKDAGRRSEAHRRRQREMQAALRAMVPGTLMTPKQLLAEQRALRAAMYERQGLPVPDAGRGSSPTSAVAHAAGVESPGVASSGEGSRRASGDVTRHRATSTAWASRPPVGSPCELCGEPTPPPKPQGRPRKFCSTRCTNRSHKARARDRKNAVAE